MIKIHLDRVLFERKMKVAELSRRTGITPKALGIIYHEGGKVIQYDTLNKICKALDCSVTELLEYVPDKEG